MLAGFTFYGSDGGFTQNVGYVNQLCYSQHQALVHITVVIGGRGIDCNSIRIHPSGMFCYHVKGQGESRVDIALVERVYFWLSRD